MSPPVSAVVRHRPPVTDEKCQRSANEGSGIVASTFVLECPTALKPSGVQVPSVSIVPLPVSTLTRSLRSTSG